MGYNILQGKMLSVQIMTLMKYYRYAVFILVTILYCKMVEKRSIKSMGINGKVIGLLKVIIIGNVLLVIPIGIIVSMGKTIYNGFHKILVTL